MVFGTAVFGGLGSSWFVGGNLGEVSLLNRLHWDGEQHAWSLKSGGITLFYYRNI